MTKSCSICSLSEQKPCNRPYVDRSKNGCTALRTKSVARNYHKLCYISSIAYIRRNSTVAGVVHGSKATAHLNVVSIVLDSSLGSSLGRIVLHMKADLDNWEKLASFYLDRQSKNSSWTLIRDDAARTLKMNAGWSAEMIQADQSLCWELLWQTFFQYKKTVLIEHLKYEKNPAHPQWATQAWKALYAEYAGDEAVEVLQLTTKLNMVKYFTASSFLCCVRNTNFWMR